MRDLPPSVLEHVRAGRKIQAIKELRERTGLGLKETKEAVDRAERGGAVSLSDPSGLAPEALAARVVELVDEGRTIQAAKDVRDATGSDLRDAKALVDRVVAEQAGGPPAASSPALVVAFIVAFLALGLALVIAVLA